MKKSVKILIVLGLIFCVAGGLAIYTSFVSQKSGGNALVFEKKVTARITDMHIYKSYDGGHMNKATGEHVGGTVSYTYHVDFFVSDDGGYTVKHRASAKEYSEYEQLEKNKDMEMNQYRNPDNNIFLSLKDIEGATEDYQSMQITKSIAIKMMGGMLAVFAGLKMLDIAGKLHKKAKIAEEEGY